MQIFMVAISLILHIVVVKSINNKDTVVWLKLLLDLFFRWTYIDESPRSGLAVLDIAIPTGYIMQQQNLDAYVLQKTVPNLQRARFFPGKLLFYFDYVTSKFYIFIYMQLKN